MATTPFIITPQQTAIAVAYRQGRFIADQVLPYVPVYTEKFSYKKYDKKDDFTVPETLVSREGTPNQIKFAETELTDQVQDHALDAPVSNANILAYEKAREAGQRVTDPMLRATAGLMNAVLTKREKRVADLVFNVNSYAAGNKQTLTAGNRFSDDAVKPHYVIGDALDSMIMRPNVAVFGRVAWTKTRRNPNLVKSVYGQGTTEGQISTQQFADLFELEAVYVGDGFINTANKGQAPTMVRLWGNDLALLYRDMSADPEFGITFGFTARFGDRVGGYLEDGDTGMRGGRRARSGESVKELITANDLGYYFKDAVA